MTKKGTKEHYIKVDAKYVGRIDRTTVWKFVSPPRVVSRAAARGRPESI